MSYSFLKPVRIGNMVLKNRVIVPAMARYLCKDGYVTDAYVEYLRAIAEGGVAMVTVGIMPIDLNWPSTMPTQPCLGDDKYIPGLTRAVAAIHAGGAKASLQPWMPGRAPYTYANAVERAQDIALVNRLTVDEIHNIQKKYAAAALRCAMAGADVVEWHNAHNYLGEQFFSPYFNHRTDEYGQQSVENSMRFAREALALTRRTLDAAGYSHVELIAKLNGSEIINDDITPELLAASAKELEKAGIALITVNGGGGLTRLEGMSGDGHRPEGWKVKYAEIVKNAVSIPVAASGNLKHPSYVDAIISEGKCDLVALGRTSICDPHWVNKCKAGREDLIRYCLSCMHCVYALPADVCGCTMNPRCRREAFTPRVEDTADRRRAQGHCRRRRPCRLPRRHHAGAARLPSDPVRQKRFSRRHDGPGRYADRQAGVPERHQLLCQYAARAEGGRPPEHGGHARAAAGRGALRRDRCSRLV